MDNAILIRKQKLKPEKTHIWKIIKILYTYLKHIRAILVCKLHIRLKRMFYLLKCEALTIIILK